MYFELTCKAYLKENMDFKNSFEKISKYISSSFYDVSFGEFHEKQGFKFYCFGGFYPIEEEKIYKKEKFYTFQIRSIDEKLIDALRLSLKKQIENPDFLVTDAVKNQIKPFYIQELYSATPVVVSTSQDNSKKPVYWTQDIDGDIAKLQNQLHENLRKKYETFYNEPLKTDINFMQLLEIKNRVPQSIHLKKNGKSIRLFGNKFRIVPNEDETSQKLATIALATGLGEKNSFGGGFMLAKGKR